MDKKEYQELLEQTNLKHKRKPEPVRTEEGYQTKALTYGNS